MVYYVEREGNDLFVLSQKVLAYLLKEIGMQASRFHLGIPTKVRILMFVESSYYWNGLDRQVEKHLGEIIEDDRRLSRLEGVDIKVTAEKQQIAKSNVIGLVFKLD